jgi:hypothetical protein
MAETRQFNPFVDRLSRNIRNALSSSLVECIALGDISPAQHVARAFLATDPEAVYVRYIEDRLQRYAKAVDTLRQGPDDPFWRSLVLWDLELFFEMHEVLEHAWYSAGGDTKLIMQALIRAAGMYIKLKHGFLPQATKMAAKALPVLELHKPFLREYFPPERLLNALRNTDPTPPKLLSS